MRFTLCVLLATACGNNSADNGVETDSTTTDSGPDGGVDGLPDGLPECAPGEFAAVGAIDGANIDVRVSANGMFFGNAIGGSVGTLTLSGLDGVIMVEWDALVSDGASTPARGLVDLSMSSGPVVGNCFEEGFLPGTFYKDDINGDGGAFVFTDLVEGADCTARSVSGELMACYRQAE
jgi:hypothetical protein